MRILAVAEQIPGPDRSSGELRFFTLLKLAAETHTIYFCPSGADAPDSYPREHIQKYEDLLASVDVPVLVGNFNTAIRTQEWDVILFEFYHSARRYLEQARLYQPASRVVVDSVDVAFKRLAAKARLTTDPQDITEAKRVKVAELEAYRRADAVLTVSNEDKYLLESLVPNTPLHVIANIHTVHEVARRAAQVPDSLIFVGGFTHKPNADAIVNFCQETLPLIRRAIPRVRLSIIGNAPPPEVRALASDYILVTGFVQETLSYLQRHRVSIAPLRYGGGMKGKVGEAMAAGLPVVATQFGAEGFGFTNGKHVLVADTPEAFSGHVVNLLRNDELYEAIRVAGWEFIRTHYSEEAVRPLLEKFFETVAETHPKTVSRIKRALFGSRQWYDRAIGWRFQADS